MEKKIKETEYKMNGVAVSYEIEENGYMIYLGGAPWVHQFEPYIPYPALGYEGSCLKQLEEICKTDTADKTDSAIK